MWNKPVNDRHERHHRHTGDKIPYISHFTNDDEHDDDVTVPEYTRNSPSCRKPYRYREKYRS
jgi:hypothetical protein